MRATAPKKQPLSTHLLLDRDSVGVRFDRFALRDFVSCTLELQLHAEVPATLDLHGKLDTLRSTASSIRRLVLEIEPDALARRVEAWVHEQDAAIDEVHVRLIDADLGVIVVIGGDRAEKVTTRCARLEPLVEDDLQLHWTTPPSEADPSLESQLPVEGRLALGTPSGWLAARLQEAGWCPPTACPLRVDSAVASTSSVRIELVALDATAPTRPQPRESHGRLVEQAIALEQALQATHSEDGSVVAALALFPRSAALWQRVADGAAAREERDAHLHALKRIAVLARSPAVRARACMDQARWLERQKPGDPSARTLLERARSLLGRDPNGLAQLARLYQETHQSLTAARTWARAADAATTAAGADRARAAEYHLEAARLWHDTLHDADNALLALRRCLAADPCEPEAVRRAFELYLAREDRERAHRLVYEATERACEHASLRTDDAELRRRAATLCHLAAHARSLRGEDAVARALSERGDQLFAGGVAALAPVDRRRNDRRRGDLAHATPPTTEPTTAQPKTATPATADGSPLGEAASPSATIDAARERVERCRRAAQRDNEDRTKKEVLVAAVRSLLPLVAGRERVDLLIEGALATYYELDAPADAIDWFRELAVASPRRLVQRPDLAGAWQELLAHAGEWAQYVAFLQARAEHAQDDKERAEWWMLAARHCLQSLHDATRAEWLLDRVPASERDAEAWTRLRARAVSVRAPLDGARLLAEAAQQADLPDRVRADLLLEAAESSRGMDVAWERRLRQEADGLAAPRTDNLRWLGRDALVRGAGTEARTWILRELTLRGGGLKALHGVDDARALLQQWDADELMWETERLAPLLVDLADAAWLMGEPREAAAWIELLDQPLAAPPDYLLAAAERADRRGAHDEAVRAWSTVRDRMLPGAARDELDQRIATRAVVPVQGDGTHGAQTPTDVRQLVWREAVSAAVLRRLEAVDALGREEPRRAVEEIDRLLPKAKKPTVRRALLARRGRWLRIEGEHADAEMSLKGALILEPDAPDTRWELAFLTLHRGDVAARANAIAELARAIDAHGLPAERDASDLRALGAELSASVLRTALTEASPGTRARFGLDGT